MTDFVPPPDPLPPQPGSSGGEPPGSPGWGIPPPGGSFQGYGGGKRASAFGSAYADWWKRLVAYFVDGLIIGVVSVLLFAIAGRPGSLLALVGSLTYFTVLIGNPRGQTVGMMALDISVRDFSTGQPIGHGRAFSRYMAMVGPILLVEVVVVLIGRSSDLALADLGVLYLIVDCLWPLWDANRQALHDKLVSSVVVDLA